MKNKSFRHVAISAMVMALLFTGGTVHAENFELSQNSATINAGDCVDLDIQGTAKLAKFTSADDNIASVDADGIVTGHKAGKTTITARIGLTTKTCKIAVVSPTIKLAKTSGQLYTDGATGTTLKLKATVKGTDKTVTWKTSNEDVATIAADGTVKAVSPGITYVRATANGKTASAKINVVKTVTDITLNSATISTRTPGNTVKLTTAITGPKKTVTWASDNPAVATVKAGTVTAKAEGTAHITATANGVSDTCTIYVQKGSINITQDEAKLYLGGTEVKTAKLTTNAAKKETVTWLTHDSNIVTVDEKGTLTAIKEGQTAVEAQSSDGTTDICVVTVADTAVDILDNEAVVRTKGLDQTHTLSAVVTGKSSKITWKSANTKIATVSKGKITGKKPGETTITATANGVSDTVKVIVNEFEPTIAVSQSKATLYTGKGNTITLKAAIDGTSKKAAWTSNNNKVATVDSKGKVIAVADGTAIITAAANGVSDSCIVTVKESKVILESNQMYMGKGDTAEILADVIGKNQAITYKSSNTKAVTVKKGVLTAKDYGEADITLTANGIPAICHVTVSECSHAFDKGVITKEPSCGTEGVKTFTCEKCGASYTELIPMTDEHQWSDWHIIKEATETAAGLRERTCSVCKKVESETLQKTDHVHSYKVTNIVAATCTEEGYKSYACACGDVYKADYTQALGHMWGSWTITRRSTETMPGEMQHTCTRCKTVETRELPALSHTHEYTTTVTPATCTQKGYTTYTCACGETYTDNYVNALGHNWAAYVVTVEPTETSEGTKTRTCTTCGSSEAVTIPKLEIEKPHEHTWKATTSIKPTCEYEGRTVYTCECGETYIGDYVEALGHDLVETITKEPTCTETGTKVITCRREGCNYTETKTLAKLPHNQVETIIIEPVCKPGNEKSGRKALVCQTCGLRTAMSNSIVPFSHKFEYQKTVYMPSKEGCAGDYYACTECGVIEVRNRVDWIPDENEIKVDLYDRITEKYPHGMLWGENTTGGTCATFADLMAYELFGIPRGIEDGYGYTATDLTEILNLHEISIPQYSKNPKNPETLQVGDFIYTPPEYTGLESGHVAIVYTIDIEKQYVELVEGNMNRATVSWSRRMTFDEIIEWADEIKTFYPPETWPEESTTEDDTEIAADNISMYNLYNDIDENTDVISIQPSDDKDTDERTTEETDETEEIVSDEINETIINNIAEIPKDTVDVETETDTQ